MSAGLSGVTPFTGPGLRRGPLSWGQKEVWAGFLAAYPDDVLHTFYRVVEVPAALRCVDRDGVDAALAGLVERHEGLRSRVVEHGDGLGTEVAAAGRIAVTEVVAEPGEESAAAHRLAGDLRLRRFDYRGEWPLRVGVVRQGSDRGELRHVVLAFCHIAADGLASDVVLRDLLTFLRGRRPRGPVLPPLDLAAWQGSTEGRAVAADAARYWAQAYERLPESMFARPLPESATNGDSTFEVRMVSSALPMALAELARRRQVSTNTILLAATALLVGEQTGHEVAGLAPTAGNRIRPENTDLVTTVAQNSLFWLDVGTSCDARHLVALLPNARSAAFRAYRWGYHDPADRVDDPGYLRPHSGFNDLRAPDRLGPPVERAAVTAAMAATTLRSAVLQETLSCRFYVRLTDEPGGLGLEVRGDQKWVPSPFVAGFAPRLEELVTSAAFATGD